MAIIFETGLSRKIFKEPSISNNSPVSPFTFTIASFLSSSQIFNLLLSYNTKMTRNNVADILKARTLISWKELQYIKAVYPDFKSRTITQIDSIPKTITDDELRQIVEKFPKLKHIDLSCAEALTNRGVSYLTQLPLEYLDLSACTKITHECFASFRQMPRLQHLNLGTNLDTWWFGAITDEDFAHLRDLNLRYLNLEDCSGITDICLAELVGMPLEHLAIHCPNVTDAGLVSLQGMTHLRHLKLYAYENISEAGLEHLKNLPIEELEISGVNFENGIQFLERMPLRKLRFFSCVIPPNSFRILQGKQIRHLELEKPNLTLHNEPFVTDEDLFDLKDLPLEYLTLKKCAFTDRGLSYLRNSPIRTLHISSHLITNAGIQNLNGAQIKSLNLEFCYKLTGQAFIHLQNMPLELLTIYNAQITEEEVASFRQNHPNIEFYFSSDIPIQTLAGLERFSGSFEPIFASFEGVNIKLRILAPSKEAKRGQKIPENRCKILF